MSFVYYFDITGELIRDNITLQEVVVVVLVVVVVVLVVGRVQFVVPVVMVVGELVVMIVVVFVGFSISGIDGDGCGDKASGFGGGSVCCCYL